MLIKVHYILKTIQLRIYIIDINCNLITPLITVQHTSKIQGSAVEHFIQLTAFNLYHDKDKIKWELSTKYQYCACESHLYWLTNIESVNNKYAGNLSHLAHQWLVDIKATMGWTFPEYAALSPFLTQLTIRRREQIAAQWQHKHQPTVQRYVVRFWQSCTKAMVIALIRRRLNLLLRYVGTDTLILTIARSFIALSLKLRGLHGSQHGVRKSAVTCIPGQKSAYHSLGTTYSLYKSHHITMILE